MASSTPLSPFPNMFRQRLRSGDVLIGCWASLATPVTTEVLGLAGFDWVLLDGEHAPNDVPSFVLQLMALKGSASAPIARPHSNDPVQIKRLLDIGFCNLLVPFVEDAHEARAAVAATRYPPRGMRGVAVSIRGNGYGTVKDYQALIDDHVTVAVQIETPKAVGHVDAICGVEGVDAVFVGPSDLAASYGHLGNPAHPDVQEGIRAVVERAKAHGVAVGILAPVEADARRYLEMGVTMLAVGSDLGVFRAATQALRDTFRQP